MGRQKMDDAIFVPRLEIKAVRDSAIDESSKEDKSKIHKHFSHKKKMKKQEFNLKFLNEMGSAMKEYNKSVDDSNDNINKETSVSLETEKKRKRSFKKSM